MAWLSCSKPGVGRQSEKLGSEVVCVKVVEADVALLTPRRKGGAVGAEGHGIDGAKVASHVCKLLSKYLRERGEKGEGVGKCPGLGGCGCRRIDCKLRGAPPPPPHPPPTLWKKRDSNLPAREDVVVTWLASCPPPMSTWSKMGEMAAALTGTVLVYVLSTCRDRGHGRGGTLS
jgi:hypothetical protein